MSFLDVIDGCQVAGDKCPLNSTHLVPGLMKVAFYTVSSSCSLKTKCQRLSGATIYLGIDSIIKREQHIWCRHNFEAYSYFFMPTSPTPPPTSTHQIPFFKSSHTYNQGQRHSRASGVKSLDPTRKKIILSSHKKITLLSHNYV